jgi:starch phosphorylase
MLERWNATAESYTQHHVRTVCYLSAEFSMGPHLGNNLVNMGIYNIVKQTMEELGLDFDDLLAQEVEPGPGNGGLGRLAALLPRFHGLPGNLPPWDTASATEFGIFHQDIRDGWQVERTDKRRRYGNPWEVGGAPVGGGGQVWRLTLKPT